MHVGWQNILRKTKARNVVLPVRIMMMMIREFLRGNHEALR